jgi:hypothetical protein
MGNKCSIDNPCSCTKQKTKKRESNKNAKAILPLAIRHKMLEDLNEMEKQVKEIKGISHESRSHTS